MTSFVEEAARAIRAGEVIGLPTDTVYGVGVDPWSEEAVAKLFDMKGRPDHKPVGVLVSGLAQADEIADLRGPVREIAERNWPGALTLVVRPKVVLANWVGTEAVPSLGIRVPDLDLARRVLAATGPLAVTSANVSGLPEAESDDEARAVFGNAIAYYVPGRAPGGKPSTVVDVTTGEMRVLRPGPVSISLG